MELFDSLCEYRMPLRTLASTFARLDVHRTMLQDRVRVEAFARAIQAVVKPGDAVVEIGTGSGILACLAARAGARKVYAIEVTDMAEIATAVVAHNGLADRVEVHRGLSTEVELPERGQVLISETLGHFGVDEGIVETLADARARLLEPGARLIPSRVQLMLALTGDRAAHEREIGFWHQPCAGLDLSPVSGWAAGRVYLRRVMESELCAIPAPAAAVDLSVATQAPRQVWATVVGRAPEPAHGIAAWFESELGGGVQLCSRATSSWHPLLFPLKPPVPIAPLQRYEVWIEARGEAAQVSWSWGVTPA